ncbi:MAG: BsaWI family type II restriction enzyme [Endomicrobium sp.]|jgi:type II restriction enzyme|nr:BsaWI family type II restriction enzyme [Endomicrobium sp.]
MNIVKNFLCYDLAKIGLNIANVKNLRFQLCSTLSDELAKVKRNLLIDYGEMGFHLPAVDFVIYKHQQGKVIAVILDKMDDYENVLGSAYIKTKFYLDPCTKHIKVFYITSNGKQIKPAKTIIDIDGNYNLIDDSIERESKIKTFAKLMKYLKKTVYK